MLLNGTLLPDSRNLKFEGIQWNGESVTINVSSGSKTAKCPGCGAASGRVHSHYMRRLQDLPLQGAAVIVHWRSRKFFCDNAKCEQRVFSEQLPKLVEKYGRKTCRLVTTLRALALECGGEAGGRLASKLAIQTTPSFLLREVRRAPDVGESKVRVLGVDDWAMRRGQRYGTILVDLESHRPLDLLPNRSADAFAEWLTKHPGVEIISRDRGEFYIRGAHAGAPHARQVTDRWHLLHNMHQVLTRVLDRQHRSLGDAAERALRVEPLVSVVPRTSEVPKPQEESAEQDSQQQQRRVRWEDKYKQVVELRSRRFSVRKIARELNLDRGTVARWLAAGGVPVRSHPRRSNRLELWAAYLESRWNAGCQNAALLTAELRGQGFRGAYSSVRRFVARWRSPRDSASCQRKRWPRPSAKLVAWWILKGAAKGTAEQHRFLELLCQDCPQADTAASLASSFSTIVREQRAEEFQAWLQQALTATEVPDVQRFAKGLQEDIEAVEAALTLPWSNGPTEGHVNRLKMIKRQMYGRAKFDLLRRRVLAHTPKSA